MLREDDSICDLRRLYIVETSNIVSLFIKRIFSSSKSYLTYDDSYDNAAVSVFLVFLNVSAVRLSFQKIAAYCIRFIQPHHSLFGLKRGWCG